jgi:hypothetical protein
MSGRWLIAGVLAGLVVVGVVVALVVSDGDTASSDSTTPTPSGLSGELSDEQQAQLEEFQDCLSDQGVEPPEPSSGPPATQQPDSEMLGALEDCQQFMPEGAGPGAGQFGAPISPSQ